LIKAVSAQPIVFLFIKIYKNDALKIASSEVIGFQLGTYYENNNGDIFQSKILRTKLMVIFSVIKAKRTLKKQQMHSPLFSSSKYIKMML
jgi:hypothetical protein